MENPQIPSLLNKKRTGNNELADNEGFGTGKVWNQPQRTGIEIQVDLWTNFWNSIFSNF